MQTDADVECAGCRRLRYVVMDIGHHRRPPKSPQSGSATAPKAQVQHRVWPVECMYGTVHTYSAYDTVQVIPMVTNESDLHSR